MSVQEGLPPSTKCMGAVRTNSHRRDTITQTWYYHTDVILCITQTWYFFLGLFFTYFEVVPRVALFKFWKFGPFWSSVCNFFGQFSENFIIFRPKRFGDSFILKYHTDVILRLIKVLRLCDTSWFPNREKQGKPKGSHSRLYAEIRDTKQKIHEPGW